MDKIIQHFKTLLPCEQFVVTGSYSFLIMGLTKKASDIDIVIVNATPEAISILDRLQDSDESKHLKNEYFGQSKKAYRIMHNSVKVDIFLDSVKVECFELSNGILVSTIPATIRAKKSYSRLKDWLQLRTYAELFFKQSEFEAFLNHETSKLTK
jgi:sucrose-6-phosphate hydrolase SacC (GH32 family)